MLKCSNSRPNIADSLQSRIFDGSYTDTNLDRTLTVSYKSPAGIHSLCINSIWIITESCIYPFIYYSLLPWVFVLSFVYVFIYLFVYWLINLFIYTYIYLPAYLFVIHVFSYLFLNFVYPHFVFVGNSQSSMLEKPGVPGDTPPNPKSLAPFSHTLIHIWALVMLRDSEQLMLRLNGKQGNKIVNFDLESVSFNEPVYYVTIIIIIVIIIIIIIIMFTIVFSRWL